MSIDYFELISIFNPASLLSPLNTLAYLASNKADDVSIFFATEHVGAFD